MHLTNFQASLLGNPNDMDTYNGFMECPSVQVLLYPKDETEAKWWYRTAIGAGWNMFDPRLYVDEIIDHIRPFHLKAMASLGWNPNQSNPDGEPFWHAVLMSSRHGNTVNLIPWELKSLGANLKCGMNNQEVWVDAWLSGLYFSRKILNENDLVDIAYKELLKAESVGMSLSLVESKKWIDFINVLCESKDTKFFEMMLRFASKETLTWLCDGSKSFGFEAWETGVIESCLLKRMNKTTPKNTAVATTVL